MIVYDNFGFIKKIDKKVYEHIHNAEKKVRTNVDQSASSFRKAFEYEIILICKRNGMEFDGENKSLYYRIIELQSKNLLPKLETKKKISKYGQDFKSEIVDAYHFMRMIGNGGSHEGGTNQEKNNQIKVNYSNMVIALELFRLMMSKIHGVNLESDFDEKRMFIEDFVVYDAKECPQWDKSGCLYQFSAYKIDSEEEISQYAIIRQYAQKTNKDLLLRNMKFFSEAMKMSEKNMPEGLTQMVEITPYNNDQGFYVIAYLFSSEPQKLYSILSKLDIVERIELSKRILVSMNDMHKYEEPIYHRLLNPDSIYVCKKREKYIPYIINFSYAKINSSKATVKAKIPDVKEAKSYGIYCKYLAPEYSFYDFKQKITNEMWKKIDLYALGVLVADILKGKISSEVVSYYDLIDSDIPEEIARRITLLHDEDIDNRIEIDSVLEIM